MTPASSKTCMQKRRIRSLLVTGGEQGVLQKTRSDEIRATESTKEKTISIWREARRHRLLNGFTRRQRTFIFEKLLGLNDKNAALAAGYSVSVAENTKQRIWNDEVREEFGRLKRELRSRISPSEGVPKSPSTFAPGGSV
jgi:hypothetical protein